MSDGMTQFLDYLYWKSTLALESARREPMPTTDEIRAMLTPEEAALFDAAIAEYKFHPHDPSLEPDAQYHRGRFVSLLYAADALRDFLNDELPWDWERFEARNEVQHRA